MPCNTTAHSAIHVQSLLLASGLVPLAAGQGCPFAKRATDNNLVPRREIPEDFGICRVASNQAGGEESLPVNVSKPDLPDIEARQNCDFTTSIVTDRTETFVDWAVQKSHVVIGTGNGIDVFVSSGYSVSNGVSVSAGLEWTVIKDKLGLSAGIDYTRTWTTQTVINVKGTVPGGSFGVMITKPIKTQSLSSDELDLKRPQSRVRY
ncbi:hypothetical protein FOC4_g10000521 [Fusarium odoratissimum]|uniref:Uncharacterized protein n=1 Tax=Fusarium oxysporum f. sp. cubense (strain race 4) TaxID=2502994 RepID=N1S3P8_FUSC4|nr:hypothetical protein FOC4_g10000521 [Fusarium odoratissimum]